MDEEIKRLEEKQKIANFEIEKRFVKMEQTIDELKTKIEKISELENVPKEVSNVEEDIDKTKEHIKSMEEQNKKNLDQITALIDALEVDTLKNEIGELKKRLDTELKAVQIIEKQFEEIKNTSKSGELFAAIKDIETRLDNIDLRLTSLEREKVTQPIFID